VAEPLFVSIGCGQYECPDDHVYKSQEDPICIPKSECKPVCMTVGNITYHEGEMMEYDDCHSWLVIEL
jgi:von Willebrand factor